MVYFAKVAGAKYDTCRAGSSRTIETPLFLCNSWGSALDVLLQMSIHFIIRVSAYTGTLVLPSFSLTLAFVSRYSYLIQEQDAAVFAGLPHSTTL